MGSGDEKKVIAIVAALVVVGAIIALIIGPAEDEEPEVTIVTAQPTPTPVPSAQDESDFYKAFERLLDPPPTRAEILQACAELEEAGWDVTEMQDRRGHVVDPRWSEAEMKAWSERVEQDRVAMIATATFSVEFDAWEKRNPSKWSNDTFQARDATVLYCHGKKEQWAS